jgi:DNA-binding transcriptional ArsR family regulator
MMSAARTTGILGERLERLTGAQASGCVPEYRAMAKEVVRSSAFPSSLERAKALSDEHRLLAVAMLRRRGELCACEIQAASGLTHATVSHHMAILANAGLVSARRKGKWMYYRLNGTAGVKIP